jgi:hypothetical protein
MVTTMSAIFVWMSESSACNNRSRMAQYGDEVTGLMTLDSGFDSQQGQRNFSTALRPTSCGFSWVFSPHLKRRGA